MQNFILSVLLILISLAGIWMTLWRFEWLREHLPFLLKWGRWPIPRFRASRVGVGAGFFAGFILGSLGLYSQFAEPSRTTLGTIILIISTLLIAAAIHDFRRDRKERRRRPH